MGQRQQPPGADLPNRWASLPWSCGMWTNRLRWKQPGSGISGPTGCSLKTQPSASPRRHTIRALPRAVLPWSSNRTRCPTRWDYAWLARSGRPACRTRPSCWAISASSSPLPRSRTFGSGPVRRDRTRDRTAGAQARDHGGRPCRHDRGSDAGAAGSDFWAIPTELASGPRTPGGHATPRDRILEPGDLVHVEFAGVARRYHAVAIQTMALGKPEYARPRNLQLTQASLAAGRAVRRGYRRKPSRGPAGAAPQGRLEGAAMMQFGYGIG